MNSIYSLISAAPEINFIPLNFNDYWEGILGNLLLSTLFFFAFVLGTYLFYWLIIILGFGLKNTAIPETTEVEII